jgi:peroxiredoxin
MLTQLLAPGTEAPNFELRSAPDQSMSLRDLRGKLIILVFYPADWSPVCGDQIALYNQLRPEFLKYGAELIGISVDSVWCHQAFAKHNNIHFPLLADFEPKGSVARSFGAYRQSDGFCERALFLIDAAGFVSWSFCSPIDVNPGADGILEALDNLAQQRS